MITVQPAPQQQSRPFKQGDLVEDKHDGLYLLGQPHGSLGCQFDYAIIRNPTGAPVPRMINNGYFKPGQAGHKLFNGKVILENVQ